MSSARSQKKAAISPEYLKVTVSGQEADDVDVLIEGEPLGKVGRLIQLTSGSWEVTVALEDAPTKIAELEHTTLANPLVMVFEIP